MRPAGGRWRAKAPSALAAPTPPMASAHRAVGEDGEAALLAVIETVVERLGGGCELLQVGGAGAQPLRGAREAIDGIDVAGLVAIPFTPLLPGGEAGRP